jgi:hypothetical protein
MLKKLSLFIILMSFGGRIWSQETASLKDFLINLPQRANSGTKIDRLQAATMIDSEMKTLSDADIESLLPQMVKDIDDPNAEVRRWAMLVVAALSQRQDGIQLIARNLDPIASRIEDSDDVVARRAFTILVFLVRIYRQ